ncbi:MAG: phosphoribosylanthranilate isomerase [Candidatus Bathyarchaeota archaeon]|nr:MAG: phosphoribosylanthranilate isomerase [Candidatus Bathyarchaeota archaeon]
MRKVKVKICGITNKEDLKIASNHGADAVGFIVGVPSSPRNISLAMAEKLIRLVPIFVKRILVMVPRNVEELFAAYDKLKPDAIQLHGKYVTNPHILREKIPHIPLIKAINANPINALKSALEATFFDAILLDSYVRGKYGGTGIVHNWDLSRQVKKTIQPKPLILAGGLTPENVKEAIAKVQPYAVDVCAGVELCLGIKDSKKVIAFIENAKSVGLYDN